MLTVLPEPVNIAALESSFRSRNRILSCPYDNILKIQLFLRRCAVGVIRVNFDLETRCEFNKLFDNLFD